MSNASRYLVIRTTTAYASQVPAYLYSTAELLPQSVQISETRVVLLVCVTAFARIDYLAQYQADRLSSGGHHAAVIDTRAEAFQAMAAALVQEA